MNHYSVRVIIAIGSLLFVLSLNTGWVGEGERKQAPPPRPTLTPVVPTLTPTPILPTLTPTPTTITDPLAEQLPDIQWSQSVALLSNNMPNQSTLVVTVHGMNVGRGYGGSDALLYYDPSILKLLDVLPQRTQDWVRNRDDISGMLTLSVGHLAPSEQTTMQVRFSVLKTTMTTIRTIRDDGLDSANPIFLDLEQPSVGTVKLTNQPHNGTNIIRGRGYKPGEKLAVWVNTKQNRGVAIDGEFTASSDDDGSINLVIPSFDQDVVSIVVFGQRSSVIGVAEVTP